MHFDNLKCIILCRLQFIHFLRCQSLYSMLKAYTANFDLLRLGRIL